jgi:hypothetical protein
MTLQNLHNPFYRWSVRGNTPVVSFRQDRESISFFGALSLKTKRVISHLSEKKKTADFIEFLEVVKENNWQVIEEKLGEHLTKLEVEVREWEEKQAKQKKRRAREKGKKQSGQKNRQDTRQKTKQKDKKEKPPYRGLILMVVDGASIHKSKELKAYLQENYGIFELMLLPAYSPDFNPQERVWKALRKHLSKVVGKYDFRAMVDRACLFLNTHTFDYKFA